jgi:cell division ATPase FtsA
VHAIQTVTTERVNETLHLLRAILQNQGIAPANLHGGVWLTGGTTALPCITEQVRAIMEAPCRVGVPINVQSLPDEVQKEPYLYATAIGLLKWRMQTLATEVHKPSVFSRIRSFFRE